MPKDIGNIIGQTINATREASTAVWNLFDQIRYKRTDDWPQVAVNASGGNVDALEPGNGYIYHTFTSSGTFTVNSAPANASMELLIVGGGGGGGGGQDAGGGGAGGLRYLTFPAVSPGSYPVVVGSGTPTGGIANGASPPSATTSALGYETRGGGQGTYYVGNYTPPGSFVAGPGGSGGGYGVVHNNNDRTGGVGNIGGFSPPEGTPGTNGSNVPGGGAVGPGITGATLPQFTGSLIGVPSLPGYYSRGGGPGGPTPINNSGYAGNGGQSGSPGIVVIRYSA